MNHIRQQIIADIIHHEFRGVSSQVETEWATRIAIDVCPIDSSNIAWFDWYGNGGKVSAEVVKINHNDIIARLIEVHKQPNKMTLSVFLATLPVYFTGKVAGCDYTVSPKQIETAWEKLLEVLRILPPDQQAKLIYLIKLPGWKECLHEDMRPRPEFIAANLRGGEYIRQRRFAPKKASLRLPHNRIPDMRKSRKAKAKRAKR